LPGAHHPSRGPQLKITPGTTAFNPGAAERAGVGRPSGNPGPRSLARAGVVKLNLTVTHDGDHRRL
jgi:hypothetical protein